MSHTVPDPSPETAELPKIPLDRMMNQNRLSLFLKPVHNCNMGAGIPGIL